MQPHNFKFMQDFLLRASGLLVADNKDYLLRSRLAPLMRLHKLDDINDLAMSVKRDERSPLAMQVVDAMTTNESLFFRDQYPFNALKTLIFPELMAAKGVAAKIRVWSAAASRGQEALSIAMTASEAVPQADRHVSLLGTDISDEALSYAKDGIYTQMEVQRGMPVKLLVRFFMQEEERWRIRPELSSMIHYQPGNLVSDNIIGEVRRHGPFDIVFCRNVLIYFSVDERKKVIDRIARSMCKGGYLLTGATEVAEGNVSRWEPVMFENRRLWKLVS
ncbi:MAG: protein-glutamate O-methyltransferase CheR [Mariprofundaceae bacterium]